MGSNTPPIIPKRLILSFSLKIFFSLFSVVSIPYRVLRIAYCVKKTRIQNSKLFCKIYIIWSNLCTLNIFADFFMGVCNTPLFFSNLKLATRNLSLITHYLSLYFYPLYAKRYTLVIFLFRYTFFNFCFYFTPFGLFLFFALYFSIDY